MLSLHRGMKKKFAFSMSSTLTLNCNCTKIWLIKIECSMHFQQFPSALALMVSDFVLIFGNGKHTSIKRAHATKMEAVKPWLS